jgi:hypothetical protein
MHANDWRSDRYGMATAWKEGGYSDDLILASIAGNGQLSPFRCTSSERDCLRRDLLRLIQETSWMNGGCFEGACMQARGFQAPVSVRITEVTQW